MGRWSLVAGQIFLDWLATPPGLRWIDVGCGSGAFTELLVSRCAPAETRGIDPSDAQLGFARIRPGARGAMFQLGDAMALPFPDDRFDAKGVAEMARVVRPGGTVAAYAWDMPGGGFPFHPIQAELRALGFIPPLPPSTDASRMDRMHELWTDAGIQSIETTRIVARRTFADFDEFWAVSTITGSIGPTIAAMAPADIEQLKARVRARLTVDAEGRVTHESRANAIKGRVPG
jgi:SAM-dependent methyltransferase